MAAEGRFHTEGRTGDLGVNGAAAGWPRKVAVIAGAHAFKIGRQWGRGRMAAEGIDAFLPGGKLCLASMGPRPDGRGRRRAVGACRRRDQRRRQWGRGRMAAEGSRPPLTTPASGSTASMGPRPDGRGRMPAASWRRRPASASMGPRPDGRGRGICRSGGRTAGSASMGPRPDGRGRVKDRLTTLHEHVLRQWGRGRMAAEGRKQDIDPLDIDLRQWGRGRMAAEGFRCLPWPHTIDQSVNGAAAGWPRKAGWPTRRSLGGGASMGPRPDGRGRPENLTPLGLIT